ncbi:Hypothetical protein CINCED_3A020308 [Cinara cedri]|uniref:Uncharacterized protein n=1 Tax=Cinara cedri TaxID=506608 RepID=A0A5E4N9A4_9HEMI|nr:Hypothetical protein CINCED_3A020308 [Cinara cedri]
MEKRLEYEKKHYTDIINDLKNKICSIEDVNQATFTSYSKTMRGLLTSEWNILQAQSDQILDNIFNYVNQYVELNKLLDELILQKKNKLEDLNNNYDTICQLKQVAQEKMISSEAIFDKLRCALTVVENTKDIYIFQVTQQNTHEEKLLNSIRDLQENIDKLKNKIVEFTEEDNEDYYNVNYNIYEFDLASSEKLNLISQFEEITNKIQVLETEKYELRWLLDSSIYKLQQEEKEKKERQKSQINSEIYERQQLLDLINKEIENVQVKISRCKDNSAAVITMNNKFDVSIKVLQTFFREEMIENHGKTLERLIKENGELTSTEVRYHNTRNMAFYHIYQEYINKYRCT